MQMSELTRGPEVQIDPSLRLALALKMQDRDKVGLLVHNKGTGTWSLSAVAFPKELGEGGCV